MSAQDNDQAKAKRGRGKAAAAVAEVELSAEEKYEAELAEQARQNSGDWDSVAPGKADNFGPSFARMIALLKPSAIWFVFVSILGAIGVVLTVAAPKVLAEATNLVYKGFISIQLGQPTDGFPASPPARRRTSSSRPCEPAAKTTLRTRSGRWATSPSARASISTRCGSSSRRSSGSMWPRPSSPGSRATSST